MPAIGKISRSGEGKEIMCHLRKLTAVPLEIVELKRGSATLR